MYPIAVALVASSLLYLGITLYLSRRPMPVPESGDADLSYVIIVPCLNEELVIASTLESLTALPSDRVRVIVVDDDSDDRTAEIVRSFAPRVELLQRRRPAARIGKGDSLNMAYAYVLDTAERPAEKVVFGVVDADGQVQTALVDVADRYFSDHQVGGLQFAISIRNRNDSLLARMQDFEFLGLAPLLLAAREHLGSVTLGGNGQFVRLSHLRMLGSHPWTDSLTEDLDLGVRLALAGSRIRFTSATRVEQQGLPDVRSWVRQRTRWVQGHLRCWSLMPKVWASEVSNKAFLDLCYLLLSPGLMLAGSVIFTFAPVILLVTLLSGTVSPEDPALYIFLAAVYLLTFGPAMIYFAFYRSFRRGEVGVLRTLAMAHFSPIYAYLWYLVTWRAVIRIVLRRNEWAKTDRLAEAPFEAGQVQEYRRT